MMRGARNPVLLLLLSLLLVVLIRTAWVSDDAFITFRTIDNFNHGFGLRWNVDERVQTYTHPLWMMLLTLLSQVVPSLYYASIALSVALTMTAVWILVTRVAAGSAAALVAVTVLIFSRSFIDYSSSGLENPLTHALLVAFLWTYFSGGDEGGVSRRRAIGTGLLAGLAMLNRLDTALLIGPALAVTWIRGRQHARASIAAAAIPVAIWELFSIVYYGFPLPNTVYAKLQTGIPGGELAMHGLSYLRDSLSADPITLTTIAGVAAVCAATRLTRDWPVVAGILLFVGGLVRAGGDFMTGRLLSAPLVCAVVLLSRFAWIDRDSRAVAVCAFAAAVGLAAPRPAVWSNSASTDTRIAPSGIADERLFYQQMTGLLLAPWRGPHPEPLQAEAAAAARREGRRSVELTQIGLYGYHAGPDLHIIDPLGLGDPLLARLPAAAGWRIGHYRRDLPAGYAESLESGTNAIRDPALAAFYERLRIITRGPIWSRRRARAIVRANLE